VNLNITSASPQQCRCGIK